VDESKDTSVVPPLIYAVMGTSREIAIGPVAVVSLLLSSMIQNVVDPAADPVAYRSIVFTVTFLTGIFQVSFGLFRCVARRFSCKYTLFLFYVALHVF
jgi:sulfate transporter 2, low-affinity